MPEIDANGNIKALVKTLNPTGKGRLNGKTIIINPGHGGAMNYKDKKTGKLNTNFKVLRKFGSPCNFAAGNLITTD